MSTIIVRWLSLLAVVVGCWAWLTLDALAQCITFSQPQRMSRRVDDFDILGKNTEGVLVHRHGDNFDAIDAYNAVNMNLRWSKEIQLPRKASVIDVVLLNQNLLVIYAERARRTNYIYARLTNAELIPVSDAVLLDSLDRQLLTGVDYSVAVSQSKQYISLLRFNYDFSGLQGINEVFFTADFSTLRHKTISTDTRQITTQHIVDNLGNVVIANYQQRNDLFRTAVQYRNIKITIYDHQTDQLHALSIEDGRYSFNDLQLGVDNLQHRAVLAGFLAEGGDQSKGYFYTTIDLQKHVFAQRTFQLFDADNIKQLSQQSTAVGKTGISNLQARDLVVRRDGGVLLMGEVNYENRTSLARGGFDPTGGMVGFATNYYYDDIFSFSINADGSLLWANAVQKKQYSEEDRGAFSSFGVFNGRNYLSLIFNEEISYNARLGSSKINIDGAYKMINLFSKQEIGLIMSPSNGKQVSDTEYVLPAFTRRSEFQLVMMNY